MTTPTARVIATYGNWTVEFDRGEDDPGHGGSDYHVVDKDCDTYDSYDTEAEAVAMAKILMIDDLRDEAAELLADVDDEAILRAIVSQMRK
jgi:hypothetical protein